MKCNRIAEVSEYASGEYEFGSDGIEVLESLHPLILQHYRDNEGREDECGKRSKGVIAVIIVGLRTDVGRRVSSRAR